MAENHHGAQFRVWDQNLNACNLYIVGKEILSGLELGSKTGHISSLLIENRRDVFLKVVAFLLKVAEIWKNDLTKLQQLFSQKFRYNYLFSV